MRTAAQHSLQGFLSQTQSLGRQDSGLAAAATTNRCSSNFSFCDFYLIARTGNFMHHHRAKQNQMISLKLSGLLKRYSLRRIPLVVLWLKQHIALVTVVVIRE